MNPTSVYAFECFSYFCPPLVQLQFAQAHLKGPSDHTGPQIKKSWMKPSQVVTMIFDDPKVWFDFCHLQKFIQMGKFGEKYNNIAKFDYFNKFFLNYQFQFDLH